MIRARLRPSWALLLAGACLVAYANGLTGAFTYDDKAIVRDNPRIRAPDRIGEIFATQYFGGPPGTGTAYRPLLLSSFAIQWWIHGGDPVAFHAVNVAFHAAATLLLAMLLLRLGLPPPAAVGAALVFAVHPVHVEAVTSIVGRGETQAALAALASILCTLRFTDGGRRRFAWLAAALAAYLAANLTKESAAVVPALVFLALAWLADGGLAARLKAALARGLPFYAGAVLTLGLVFAVRARVLGGALKAGHTGIFELENPLAPLPALSRAANACAVFFRGLGRLVLPLRLTSDESAWSIRPLTPRDVLFWAAPALLAALLAAALSRLSRRAASAFGLLFLGLAALPTSNLLFPTGTIFAERLWYLPSAGFCVIAAVAVLGGARGFTEVPPARLVLFAAAVVLLAARTIARNPVWDSDEALFTNMVRISPDSAKAHYDFAYMSAERGRPRAALEHYRRATEIYPGYWDAWLGRGRMEREVGDLAASLAACEEALRLAPDNEGAHFCVGLTLEQLGRTAEAEASYRRGLRRSPRSLSLSYRLAVLLSAAHRPEALHAWHRALAIEPGSLPSRVGYAQWLEDSGRREDALAEIRRALRLSPRYGPALELEKRLSAPDGPAAAPPAGPGSPGASARGGAGPPARRRGDAGGGTGAALPA